MTYRVSDSPSRAVAITPSDSAQVALVGLYVGGAGNVAVVPEGQNTAVTFTAVPVGTTLWLRIRQVNATNTTATNLVGLQA